MIMQTNRIQAVAQALPRTRRSQHHALTTLLLILTMAVNSRNQGIGASCVFPGPRYLMVIWVRELTMFLRAMVFFARVILWISLGTVGSTTGLRVA